MSRFLAHDSEAGELRLVFADLWEGQHERTEYTVVNADGSPIRGRSDMDGTPVYGARGDWYVRTPFGDGRIPVRTQPGQRSDTKRTPCRRAASKSGRARCDLCTA